MDDAPQKQPFMKRLQDRLAASRFFTISLLLHSIVVVLGGGVVLFKAYVEPPDFTAEGSGLVGEEVANVAPPEDATASTTEVFTPDVPQVNAPTIDTITSTSTTQASFKMPSMPTPVKPLNTGEISNTVAKAARSAMG